MEWSDNLLTGVDLIDSQHMDILRMVTIFHESVKRGGGMARSNLQALISYMEAHCAAEEELLIRSRHPQYGKHRRKHTILLVNLRKFSDYVEINPLNPYTGEFIISETANWLIAHMKQMDRDIFK